VKEAFDLFDGDGSGNIDQKEEGFLNCCNYCAQCNSGLRSIN